MKKDTRRDFMKLISIAPAGGLLLTVGCADNPQRKAENYPDTPKQSDTPNPPDIKNGSGDRSDLTSAEVEKSCEVTGKDVEGPFFEAGAPNRTKLAAANEPGELLRVEGRVLDENCNAVAGAHLDIWHADADGNYHKPGAEYRLRGQMTTDAEGKYGFETIMPGRYPLGESLRPAHVHFIVSKPGFIPLTTQLYFRGDPYLKPNDPCGNGCNSGDPTLIVPLTKTGEFSEAQFEIVLKK